MPTQANTFGVLQAVQAFVQTNLATLTINGAPALSPFNAADAAKYGTANAIYIFDPKDETNLYPRKCYIIPGPDEVNRHAFGGKVWDEMNVYIEFLYWDVSNRYQAAQDLTKFRDAAYAQFMLHAELVGLPGLVEASKIQKSSTPVGYHYLSETGRQWQCWGFNWWIKSQYNVGTIIP